MLAPLFLSPRRKDKDSCRHQLWRTLVIGGDTRDRGSACFLVSCTSIDHWDNAKILHIP